jgi:hypothetical protein
MLYASLTGPLLGVYYPVPTDDDTEACLMLNTSKLKSLWCSLYTEDEALVQINRHGGLMLDAGFAKRLDYDSHAVYLATRQG